MTIFQRNRGLIGCALLGAFLWTIVGVATEFALTHGLLPGVWGAYVAPISYKQHIAAGMLGAILGAINGVVLSVHVLALERNRFVEQMRTLRVVAIGGIASAIVIGLLFGSAWVVLAAAIMGAASNACILWVVRRATRTSRPSAPSEQQSPREAT